jgi:hypothetical protein
MDIGDRPDHKAMGQDQEQMFADLEEMTKMFRAQEATQASPHL